MGLSPVGGAFGGISEEGALGLGLNPASALAPERQFAMDVGALHWASTITLKNQDPATGQGWMPMPYMAVSTPIGEQLGLGLSVQMPWGGGGAFPEEGGQRFHIIEGAAFAFEADLALAWAATDWLSLGGAARIAQGLMAREQAFDTGIMMYDMALGLGIPIGDPFLEGRQSMDLSGRGTGFALGASIDLPGNASVHAAWRSEMAIPLTGTFSMIPSNDLLIEMSGNVVTEMVFPEEWNVALVLPAGDRTTLTLEGGWTGWSSIAMMEGTMEDMVVTPDSQALASLMEDYGVTDLDFLTNPQAFAVAMGHNDTFNGGISINWSANEKLDLRLGAFYSPAAIPDAYLHAANQDYNTLDLRSGVKWQASKWLTTGLSFDLYADGPRTTSESVFDGTHSQLSGTALPSGEGTYSLDRYRIGLTFLVQ